jgi:hypothetical protein
MHGGVLLVKCVKLTLLTRWTCWGIIWSLCIGPAAAVVSESLPLSNSSVQVVPSIKPCWFYLRAGGSSSGAVSVL